MLSRKLAPPPLPQGEGWGEGIKLPETGGKYRFHYISQTWDQPPDLRGLDPAAVLRLNEVLDAFHLPAPLLPGYGSLMKAIQAVIETSRSSVRDDERGVGHWVFPVQ